MATTTKTVLGNIITAVTNNITKIKEAIGDATTSSNGLMSGDDKTKLDSMEEGATKTTIANNLTSTTTGSALDATQGKVLSDKLASFQTGVDTLYNTGVSLGVTPVSKTPDAIDEAIRYTGFEQTLYKKCVSLGVTPTAKTFSAVANAIDSLSSSSSDTTNVYIVYPTEIVGLASGVEPNTNKKYTSGKHFKFSNIHSVCNNKSAPAVYNFYLDYYQDNDTNAYGSAYAETPQWSKCDTNVSFTKAEWYSIQSTNDLMLMSIPKNMFSKLELHQSSGISSSEEYDKDLAYVWPKAEWSRITISNCIFFILSFEFTAATYNSMNEEYDDRYKYAVAYGSPTSYNVEKVI